jgi:hypothetical protein
MRHNTTSGKSHSNTWRWTAGNDGRPALTRHKAISQPHQRQRPMQAIPAPTLVMIQAAFAFGILTERLDGPAAVGQCEQRMPPRVRWQVTDTPLHLVALARHRALVEQPALWAGPAPRMVGGAPRAPRGSVHPHRRKWLPQDSARMLALDDWLPALLWQRVESAWVS